MCYQVSSKKVASLEKQLQELRENGESSTGRKKKSAPSAEVRVVFFVVVVIVAYV